MTAREDPQARWWWTQKAILYALQTAPKTRWTLRVPYPAKHPRLAHDTIRDYFVDESHRARERILSGVLQWATTGKWPPLRYAASFFLREMLKKALRISPGDAPPDTIRDGFCAPPWSMDKAAHVADAVVMEWYLRSLREWATAVATIEFEYQEKSFREDNLQW